METGEDGRLEVEGHGGEDRQLKRGGRLVASWRFNAGEFDDSEAA